MFLAGRPCAPEYSHDGRFQNAQAPPGIVYSLEKRNASNQADQPNPRGKVDYH
jgi:hypothetical protein